MGVKASVLYFGDIPDVFATILGFFEFQNHLKSFSTVINYNPENKVKVYDSTPHHKSRLQIDNVSAQSVRTLPIIYRNHDNHLVPLLKKGNFNCD